MTACEHCPTPGRCHGATGQIPGLCEWAAMGGHWRDRVARRNALPPPGQSPPLPDVPAIVAEQRRQSMRAIYAAERIARSCPYRDHHCGCDLPTCHAGYGDHDDGRKASRDHCVSCLKSTWSLP